MRMYTCKKCGSADVQAKIYVWINQTFNQYDPDDVDQNDPETYCANCNDHGLGLRLKKTGSQTKEEVVMEKRKETLKEAGYQYIADQWD